MSVYRIWQVSLQLRCISKNNSLKKRMFLDVTDGCEQKSVKNVYNKNSKWWISHTCKWWSLIYCKYQLFFVIFKSPKQRLETYCFCSVSYYYYYYYYSSCSCYSPFFPCTMNLSTADLRYYRTEFHETWWSYRYMFLVDPKVFRFVVKGVKAIFLEVQRGWGLL